MRYTTRLSAMMFALGPAGLLMATDAAQCGSDAPCADDPMSFSGYFDGVLYSEDLVGQTYAYVESICVNVDGDPFYSTNTDDFQTYVLLEEIEGYEVYVIVAANFKYPWAWDGGLEIMVFYDAAYASAHTGDPVPLDGSGAIAYYWSEGFWDASVDPQFVSDSGEITFEVVSRVPGGFVDAEYGGHLIPYSASSEPRLRPLRLSDPPLRW